MVRAAWRARRSRCPATPVSLPAPARRYPRHPEPARCGTTGRVSSRRRAVSAGGLGSMPALSAHDPW